MRISDWSSDVCSSDFGRASRLRPPAEMTDENGTVRVDTGIVEGSEISMFYDPMIAKLITWAETREAAIDRQIDALDNYELKGLGPKIDFMSAVMQHRSEERRVGKECVRQCRARWER